MNCPKCKSSQIDVIDSREKPDNTRYRRRACLGCGFRFSTIETINERKLKKMKVVLDPGAIMPTRAHDLDAGYDLYSREDATVWQSAGGKFDTGVHIQIPAGHVGFVKSKSGLNAKYGIQAEGVIDAGYTGSINVLLRNHGPKAVDIKKGQKIAQLVILPIITPDLQLVGSLEETERGDNGFGSTGKF